MSIGEWILAVVAALGLGLGKAGLSGMGMFHVLVFAFLFGARASTGVVLPLLLIGDVAAVRTFHQHARWDYVRRMLPPACLGVVLAAWFMRDLDERLYRPVIGWVTLILSILQFVRIIGPTGSATCRTRGGSPGRPGAGYSSGSCNGSSSTCCSRLPRSRRSG